MGTRSSLLRSFRLSARTLELLDAAAAESHESRNALTDRLLGEALRVERHPLIRFHSGAAGGRHPLLVGTRLYVHQVIATLRSSRRNVRETASYLGLSPQQVQAAWEYYAEFKDEVDRDAAEADRAAREERARSTRRERALA
jgi:uncharacterized protein (DUF433 family)